MSWMRPLNRARRRGVTLIELLVVILVMLMITAVTVPAISPVLQGRKIREGARIVEVFLNSARNRAVADAKIVGVKFEVANEEPFVCRSLSIVEQPDPWTGDYAVSSVALLGNGGFGSWSVLPIPGAIPAAVVSTGSPFTKADVGWVGNIAPGDTFTLTHDDTTLYRLYAGEPFMDLNGNGQWDPAATQTVYDPVAGFVTTTGPEPFNDVDGSGGYTQPNPAVLDPESGMFIGSPPGTWPQITWGSPTAFITYTYADPIAAANTMSPTGRNINPLPLTLDMPIWLSTAQDAITSATNVPKPPAAIGTLPLALPVQSFSFNRRPIPLSTTKVDLPDGVVVDMGANFVPPGTTNIIGVPGAGLDMFVPFSAGGSTLGNYATFRPNPICDPSVNTSASTTSVNDFNRSVIVTFDPSGVLSWVYSWDERHFANSTASLSSSVPIFTDYQGRLATSPVYFLIGKAELAGGDAAAAEKIGNGQAPIVPAFNVQDPESIWVSIGPKTGLITVAENTGPDLTAAPPGTTPTQLQLYFNAQAYQARGLARDASDMGGM